VSPLTKAGVGHLIKMKRLHTLDFADGSDWQHRNFDPDLILSVAGQVPSLQNFGFREGVCNSNDFIQHFGRKYPEKQLVVDFLKYVPFLVILFRREL
jgi:hypothetical protein